MENMIIEDVNYLCQQSSGRINIILSGMIALMNDTDGKVAMLESQKWFQRMVKTVTGKNKLTQGEIQKNHDKLNAYMSQAIAELYNRNCIDHQVMLSLGTQLNEIYIDHLQLKNMLGSFVSKLNEKIDSIDNFHMLITEIEQGVYSQTSPIISICKVISQFDSRILEDDRKLDILRRNLIAQKIINEESIYLTDYLMEVLEMPVDEFGQIYLELSTINNNFMANIILKTMDKYCFLSDIERKLKNKDTLIREVIQKEGLVDTASLCINEIYHDFISSKIAINTNRIRSKGKEDEGEFDEKEKVVIESKFDRDYEEVKKDFPRIVESEHKVVQYNIAVCYHDGCGVVRDDRKARKWLIKSAQQGYSCAIKKLDEWYGEDYSE